MGLRKASTEVGQDIPKSDGKAVESGTEAAIERLKAAKKTSEAIVVPRTTPVYKQRDFDAEARGKTRCALYGEIMSGPFIATLSLSGKTTAEQVEEIKKIVRALADDGVAYTFGE